MSFKLFLLNFCFIALTTCFALNCGKRSVDNQWYIIAGSDAKKGEFPWQVADTTQSDNPHLNLSLVHCGGSVLNEKWILSAGHCYQYLNKINYTKRHKIRLGVNRINTHLGETEPPENSEIVATIDKIILHEHFNLTENKQTFELINDIALIKLKDKIDFSKNKFVSPICLAKNDTKLTKKCLSTGWGVSYISDDGGVMMPDILQKVEMPLQPNELCHKASVSNPNITIYFDESMHICAGANHNKSSCNGDSGGPLQCEGTDGLWYQMGITSFRFQSCGYENMPQAFTRVPAYIDWIERTMANN